MAFVALPSNTRFVIFRSYNNVLVVTLEFEIKQETSLTKKHFETVSTGVFVSVPLNTLLVQRETKDFIVEGLSC